ncbi:MAG: hydroxymethylglutaryl-CoA lyase [Bdellovibrionales bacterium]|jgi:hydroxymethylglutaryl-CoA lyase|nr:hydroxymethylglutaryl-CoA lyase [Bdellovibrionales bacterium]
MALFKDLPKKVKIVEVGPRDGLQNEKTILSLEDKVKYINLLIEAGLNSLEVCSFVRADKIPQMADSEKLYEKIEKKENVHLSCLVPNEKGMERALSLGVKEIALFTATSDTFNQKNINTNIKESLSRLEKVATMAQKENIRIRGYISTVFGCPYEGNTSTDTLMEVIQKLIDFGAYEVSLGDTIGVGNPKQVDKVLDKVLEKYSVDKLAMHFHDTRGLALANILTSLQKGIYIFDSSSGGLGGCPYATGASGNVATEDVFYLLHSLGIETGIDIEKLVKASTFILNKLNKTTPSRYLSTLIAGK